jgi:hypothetical protein
MYYVRLYNVKNKELILENKQEKIVRLGFPFYSENKILINNFEKDYNKNIERLITILRIVMKPISI